MFTSQYINFVCLLFGAGQIMYSGFLRAFSLKPLLAAAKNEQVFQR